MHNESLFLPLTLYHRDSATQKKDLNSKEAAKGSLERVVMTGQDWKSANGIHM